MSKFLSPAVTTLTPYVPGEQPKDTGITKLNTNENPYPPAPGVEKVLKAFDTARLRLYPDPDASDLKAAIAHEFAVNHEQVFVGNGSDEVLALTFMAYFRHPKPLLMPSTTYSFYDVYCNLCDIEFKHIPLTEQFEIDLDDYAEPNAGVIFANPNAPTGHCLPLDKIEGLLQRNTESLVVVDEAYVDFGGESAAKLIDTYDNLLVIQTFSKSRSLAGMRVGFALGNAELIAGLERVKNSFNSYPLDMLAINTAIASLEDKTYFEDTCSKIVETREWTTEALTRLGFITVPSSTNFVFTRHRFIHAAELMGFLRANRVLVRHFSKPGIDNYLRITIGTPEEMTLLVDTLKRHPDMLEMDAQ